METELVADSEFCGLMNWLECQGYGKDGVHHVVNCPKTTEAGIVAAAAGGKPAPGTPASAATSPVVAAATPTKVVTVTPPATAPAKIVKPDKKPKSTK